MTHTTIGTDAEQTVPLVGHCAAVPDYSTGEVDSHRLEGIRGLGDRYVARCSCGAETRPRATRPEVIALLDSDHLMPLRAQAQRANAAEARRVAEVAPSAEVETLGVWDGPAWATDSHVDDGVVEWTRTASATAAIYNAYPDCPADLTAVRLMACDSVEVQDGRVRATRSEARVLVGDDEYTVPEARRLIAALVECCDRVEAAEGAK